MFGEAGRLTLVAVLGREAITFTGAGWNFGSSGKEENSESPSSILCTFCLHFALAKFRKLGAK
jgi:hypothetical protein